MARIRPTVWQTKAEVALKSLDAANEEIGRLNRIRSALEEAIRNLRRELSAPLWCEFVNHQNGDVQIIAHRGPPPPQTVKFSATSVEADNGKRA